MAVKKFDLPDIGTVHVYKRAGARNLRLTIRSDGTVRVTIPAWSPYAAGTSFARSRADWIRRHAGGPKASLVDGQAIGKSHRLKLVPTHGISKPRSRIGQTEVLIAYPAMLAIEHELVQEIAASASLRAMKKQAEHLLPMRLKELAARHDFQYKQVTIKNLKSRWGSCDQDKNITLNLFLMQLPWPLIDYVLLHELTHTKIMRHGPPFWSAMEAIEPKTQALRREIKAYKTTLR